ADGMLPHIVFDTSLAHHAYFPGPDLWRSERQPGAPRGVHTSGITQPPLHALTALRLHESAADLDSSRAFLARLHPMLAAQHDYPATARDLDSSGPIALCHPSAPSSSRPAPTRPPGAPTPSPPVRTTTATSGSPPSSATPATAPATSATPTPSPSRTPSSTRRTSPPATPSPRSPRSSAPTPRP